MLLMYLNRSVWTFKEATHTKMVWLGAVRHSTLKKKNTERKKGRKEGRKEERGHLVTRKPSRSKGESTDQEHTWAFGPLGFASSSTWKHTPTLAGQTRQEGLTQHSAALVAIFLLFKQPQKPYLCAPVCMIRNSTLLSDSSHCKHAECLLYP